MTGPTHSRTGVTLVELLLAIAIAVLLTTLLYSVYHTVASTAEGQRRRHDLRAGPTATADRLMEDLQQAFLPAEDTSCVFTLTPGEQGGRVFDALSFCAMGTPSNTSDLAWAEPIRIEYRVTGAGQDEPTLVREHRPLTGASALLVETNTLVSSVTRFDLAIFDGTEWQETWPPESGDEAPPPPRAVRVDLETKRTEEPLHLEIYIPVGYAIEPEEQETANGR